MIILYLQNVLKTLSYIVNILKAEKTHGLRSNICYPNDMVRLNKEKLKKY